jgi:hypothetical protein
MVSTPSASQYADKTKQEQRDDEKYPSVVPQEQPGLELAEQPPPWYKDEYSQISELPGSHTYMAGYVATEQRIAYEVGQENHGLTGTEGQHEKPVESRRRICGMKKAVFWSILALILVVIIAAVGGGVVASKSMNSKKSASTVLSPDTVGSTRSSGGASSAAASSTSTTNPIAAATSSSATSVGSSSGTASAVAVVKHNVASSSSGTADGSTSQLQTFSQDLSSGDITYRLYVSPQKGWQSVHQAALTIAPNIGTPLTSVTQYEETTSTTFVNLFYLTGSSTTDVAQANMTCVGTAATCTVTYNNIITSGTTHPVHPSSGLAAVHGAFGWRVYYSQTDGTVVEALISKEVWKFGIPLSSAITAEGSNIAALLAPPSAINLFYVDQSGSLTTLVYPGGWKSKWMYSAM